MNVSRTAAWLGRSLGICALAVGLAGGLGLTAASVASASNGTGYLRLAHLSPNTPAVDVYLYSFGDPSAMVVLHHVGYGDVSPYEAVNSGEYTVAMRAAGAKPSSKPVLSTTINVVNGHAYTVAGMGPLAGLKLQVIGDSLAMERNQALVRVIQASMHQNSVTVTAGMKVLGHGLSFTTVTPYSTVQPGTVMVTAKGTTEHGSGQFTLAAGTIYTMVVLDNGKELKVQDLVDSSGSKVMPSGSAATGFGGTAAHPGASLLPWAAAAGAGVLVAAGGLVRLRRRRRPAMHAR
ncbi:MAG TPA: DUF4397 domain-containing protein [Streptosporangiaceae bacterium]|jgi:hypothetical protein